MTAQNFRHAAICLLLASPAYAQDSSVTPSTTIFGIAFDKELAVSECEIEKASHTYTLTSPKDGPCYQVTPPGKAPPFDHQYVKIRFPLGKEPKLTIDGSLYGRMVSNRLQRVTYRTMGLAQQDLVYSSLVDKFGKPAVLQNPQASNKLGATFSTIEALWDLGAGVTVVYASSWNSTEEGKVIVATVDGKKSEDAAMSKLLQRGSDL